MKPVILISTEDGFADNGMSNFVISKAYSRAVQLAGGIPVTALDIRTVEEYSQLADALLLTGGPVIHPARYGGIAVNFNELAGFSQTRDELDFSLGRRFIELGKPVLGIGRGAMVVNVLMGGTALKKLPELPKISTDRLDGKVKEILGEEVTFSRQYNWGIGGLGRGMAASAVSPEGVVDAVFHESLPILGVVWHPERELDGIPADNRLFYYLVREAAK